MNFIEASIEFYFKGVRHTPSAVIELDACMHHRDLTVFFYHHLASENGIGSHTYEFDMMVMEEISFSNPSGLATEFFNEGRFDAEGFRERWLKENIVDILQPIASQHLGIDNLNDHPNVKAALIAAYQAK
ncbi:MAG: hypothetical protein CO186_05120 [Zetaproteobacteria bacterium CG_4_9_14_3_um_filter_49_83]|nr:MAG: hypothetical protein AUJ56_08570 [Zetaproteobacteria bacterium CG1_02_49_23]PIQ32585.1 MAG: hypothetical protein COW62_07255 [Zetaproteobacteria bacterium CG17_big_fil_post_rev_8_21_14_2_50_50_13]PIV30684.1 MAG: hypothetical protein COS35_05415 [Zetaproteobacteria bacterium CG02_land_8_20_14_3_00_50_9]PIY56477.1 MAG: hypothetical protein COZ00_04015 [Zetaproteobacteria bacterium CG_4_10_14_0_8_um_filter_49_80]PJA35578.1 MAG: hypothetical protein CO186_05120 [Zetaproteobacteria bacterium